jgi:adenosylhomocysteine nucleosidase
MPRLGIVSAMAEELRGLQQHLQRPRCIQRAGREFWTGTLCGTPVVLVLSRIGKVAAATTVSVLLAEFGVDRVFLTGSAGGLGDGVRVGDIVVAQSLMQHDMDASPLFPRHDVPLYGRARFETDAGMTAEALAAATGVLDALHRGSGPVLAGGLGAAYLEAFGVRQPRVHAGLVISGDRFVSSAAECAALRAELPLALAVEMEGAAVAQVCFDFGVPFSVLRTVSDRADDEAHVDFVRFVADVASRYTVAVTMALLSVESGDPP